VPINLRSSLELVKLNLKVQILHSKRMGQFLNLSEEVLAPWYSSVTILCTTCLKRAAPSSTSGPVKRASVASLN